MSSLRQWRCSGDSSPTHLCLTGGKLSVPDDMASAFLNAYAQCIVRGEDLFLVEVRTKVFRFFVDLDVRCEASQAFPEAEVCDAMQGAMLECFPGSDTSAVVMTTDPKPLENGLKRGFHVVWPSIFVSAATALVVRDTLVAALVSALTDRDWDWNKIVDIAVYRGSGLRMPWSKKSSTDRRVYVPALAVSPCGTTSEVCPRGLASIRDWVRLCSIRSPGSSETPCALAVLDPAASVSNSDNAAASVSMSEYRGALTALDACLPPQYFGQAFLAARKVENDDGSGACFVLRSSSRWCGNLGRAHNSNNVYFVLTRTGISQRCYCRCDTTQGRKFGLCSEYRSREFPVPDDVIRAFFGSTGQPAVVTVRELPSQTTSSLDQILAHSRPSAKSKKRRRKCNFI